MGENINIFGSNDALRNFIYASDVVEVIKKVIENEYTGIYTVISPTNVRISDIAKNALSGWN